MSFGPSPHTHMPLKWCFHLFPITWQTVKLFIALIFGPFSFTQRIQWYAWNWFGCNNPGKKRRRKQERKKQTVEKLSIQLVRINCQLLLVCLYSFRVYYSVVDFPIVWLRNVSFDNWIVRNMMVELIVSARIFVYVLASY